MPRFDLRQDEGTLDPLAIFKVLAVMCHPNDRIQREKMLGIIEKETGVARPRRHPVTAEAFMQEVPTYFPTSGRRRQPFADDASASP